MLLNILAEVEQPFRKESARTSPGSSPCLSGLSHLFGMTAASDDSSGLKECEKARERETRN